MLELQTVRNPARADVHRVPCVQEAKTAALQPTPYAPPVLDVEAFAQDLAALIPSCPPSILHNTATVFLAAGCSADSISEVQAFNWRVPGVAAHFLRSIAGTGATRNRSGLSRLGASAHSTHWNSAPFILASFRRPGNPDVQCNYAPTTFDDMNPALPIIRNIPEFP